MLHMDPNMGPSLSWGFCCQYMDTITDEFLLYHSSIFFILRK
jgi:hypothetical protein